MFSQYKDGFRKLKAGQLDQAYAIFNKNYEDEVDITCSKYGPALRQPWF